MESLLGTSLPVFIGLTLILMGGCAFMMGQAMANSWKPVALVFFYSALLGAGDRFLTWGLFEGDLLSATGYLVHTFVLGCLALISYRATLARRMASQYPWLYVRTGLFTWRERQSF